MPGPLPDGAQPHVQQRPHRGHALISPGQGAGDDDRSGAMDRTKEARRSCERSSIWRSRLQAEIAGLGQLQKPAKKGKELFTYNTYSMAMLANKRIPVTESVWVELSGLKSAGQTYSDLLEEMIEDRKKARLFRDMERIEEEDEFAEFPW